jgi:hypothetical protein
MVFIRVNYMFLICCRQLRAFSVSILSSEKPCWHLVRGHCSTMCWFLFLHRIDKRGFHECSSETACYCICQLFFRLKSSSIWRAPCDKCLLLSFFGFNCRAKEICVLIFITSLTSILCKWVIQTDSHNFQTLTKCKYSNTLSSYNLIPLFLTIT